jgi:hypothetical protein
MSLRANILRSAAGAAWLLLAGATVAQPPAPERPAQEPSGEGSAPANTFTVPRGIPNWGSFGNETDIGSPIVRLEGGGLLDQDRVRTAREVASHSTGTPSWENPRAFEKDVFTFARAIFNVTPNTAPGHGWGQRFGWWVDFPDADLNLSYRLQQMTSMKVDPDGRPLKFTDPDLHDHPFLLMVHPGYIKLTQAEVAGMRKYLLAGGAIAVIDFWNTREWQGFAQAMKQVLPDRDWTELSMDHPIFRCVFDIKGPMQRLQVPTMQFWNREHDFNNPDSSSSVSWRWRGEGSEKMSVRALHDDKGRIMVIAFHNSDITDGWEREGEQPDYFSVFSERVSYPLGVNLIFYLMTH